MKRKVLIINFLCICSIVFAQDTLKVTTEQGIFTPPQYQIVYDKTDAEQLATKSLFKVGLTSAFEGNLWGFEPSVRLEYERSIRPRLSINSTISYFAGYYNNNLSLSVEPRYYLKSKNDGSNTQASNLDGSYVGLSAFAYKTIREYKWTDNRIPVGIMATYGIQKRFLNRFYANYQFGAGFGNGTLTDNFVKSTNSDFTFFLNNRFAVGFAFGGKKTTADKCDIFNCFEEENSLIKLDLRNALGINANGIGVNIGVIHEKKIKETAWSLNSGISLKAGNFTNNSAYGIGLSLEPRYYYNLRKRIAKGQSANNLSGSYFSVEFSESFNHATYEGGQGNYSLLTIKPKWGIQKRIFKNGFIDFSVTPVEYQFFNGKIQYKKPDGTWGDKRHTRKSSYNSNFERAVNNIMIPIFDFKVGFAF
jgi:hypothetical protein